jgi:hypothetical protein
MQTELFEVYKRICSKHYCLDDLTPFIERVYKINLALVKSKNIPLKLKEEELEEKTLEITANLFYNNREGVPVIFEILKTDGEVLEDYVEFEWKLYQILKHNFSNHSNQAVISKNIKLG